MFIQCLVLVVSFAMRRLDFSMAVLGAPVFRSRHNLYLFTFLVLKTGEGAIRRM